MTTWLAVLTLRQFWAKNVLPLTTIYEVCQKYLSILTLGEAQRKNSHFTISFSTFLHHLLVYMFKATVHFKCTLCVFVILLCIYTFSLLHLLVVSCCRGEYVLCFWAERGSVAVAAVACWCQGVPPSVTQHSTSAENVRQLSGRPGQQPATAADRQ